jgi:hypothetical protein
MLAKFIVAVLPIVCTALSRDTSEAFLASPVKDEETMGPNMHFEPLSTTMKCVLNLTIQYIVVYTALGIARSYCDFKSVAHKDSAIQVALLAASETMFFAPMACLMFIGFRMRVLQLTKGEGNPQPWARMCMEFVMYSITANTVIALVIPLFTPNKVEFTETGDLKTESEGGKNPFSSPVMMTIFTVLRYVLFLGLYVGFGGVLVAVFRFKPPAGVWEGEIPDVSPAVACTMTLSCAFFLCYLMLAISKTYTQFAAGNTATTKFEEVVKMAANTMGLAPMLCVLFLGTRMRALHMDPVNGNPQRWAQNCFYVCTYALICQTCVAIFVPLVLGGDVKKRVDKSGIEVSGDIEVGGEAVNNLWGGYFAKALTAVRFFIMVCVYACALAVVCAVFTMEHPGGKELTPPISPTMQCVINLSFQYFFCYILLWIFITVEDFIDIDLAFIKDAIETAKTTVQFAPMLCVLFIATRMRALQISKNKGAPQGWAQDGMYLASWALLIQFLMCLILPIFTGKKYNTDSLDGSKKADPKPIENPVGAWIVTVFRYLALICLFAGVITVVTSVLMITPETANGRGSIPVVGDGTLGVDLVPGAPPAVTDIPGAKGAMEATGSTVGSGADVVSDAGETVAAAPAGVADTTKKAVSF